MLFMRAAAQREKTDYDRTDRILKDSGKIQPDSRWQIPLYHHSFQHFI